MDTWPRLYNGFVVAAAGFGLWAMIVGIVSYWRDDGDWPTFLTAVGAIALMVVFAFAGGRAIRWAQNRLHSQSGSKSEDS